MLFVFIIVSIIPLFFHCPLDNYKDKAISKINQMQNQIIMLSNQMLPTGYLTCICTEIDAEVSHCGNIQGRILLSIITSIL